jgi:hypothetical protein
VIGVIHFDVGILQEFEDAVLTEIVKDADVVRAIAAVQDARTTAVREEAITQLMEKLE